MTMRPVPSCSRPTDHSGTRLADVEGGVVRNGVALGISLLGDDLDPRIRHSSRLRTMPPAANEGLRVRNLCARCWTLRPDAERARSTQKGGDESGQRRYVNRSRLTGERVRILHMLRDNDRLEPSTSDYFISSNTEKAQSHFGVCLPVRSHL